MGPLVGWSLAALVAVICVTVTVLMLNRPPEEVQSYEVPRPPLQRLLVLMVPHGDSTWFIKLQGPATEVQKHKKDFDRLINSVRFTGSSHRPLAWTVPEGWRQEAGNENRYATLVQESGKHPLEISVTKLGKAASGLVDNVDRWRGHLGLLPIGTQADLEAVCRDKAIDGEPGRLIDMEGPGSGDAPMPGPARMAKSPVPARRPVAVPRYTAPMGWTPVPDPGPFRQVAFQIREGDKVTEVSITSLAGPARGLLANVNRWRGQLGLQPVTQEGLDKTERHIRVGGESVPYVDLVSPGGEAAQQRILAAGVDQGDQTWYFTMKGPDKVVRRHQAEFEAFVKSVQFGGEGENHE
jgi:hypothetical protein